MTLAEVTSRALGDELTDLNGFWTTRTTSLIQKDTQLQSATSGLVYGGSPAVVCTLSSGAFSASVVAGQLVRILSGTYAGYYALVLTRDSDTQVTLQSAFADVDGNVAAALSDEAWEVVTLAATSIPVESTLHFPDTGKVVLDGRVYTYSSKTLTTFDGITYDDGTGALTSGVVQDHQPLSHAMDFSRALSAIDQYRRSFMVDTAVGEDLDVVGRNVGVPRPSPISDDTMYRNLIKAIAYVPRGTLYAVRQALDVLIGSGNYVIHEDLTGATLQNPARIFITATGGINERYVGKCFLDGGTEAVPLDSTTEFTLPDDNHVKIHGITPYPEGGPKTVDGSRTLVIQSSDSGVTITGSAGTFSTRIAKGDNIILLDGGNSGKMATVVSRDSDTQITVGDVPGITDDNGGAGFGFNFSGLSWKVVRFKNNFKFYRPSAASYQEGGQTVTPWAYVGGGTEATIVTPDTLGGGTFRYMNINTGTNIAAYRKVLRVRPEDTVLIEAMFDVDTTQPSGSSPEQNAVCFGDGNRFFAFGTQGDAGLAHLNAGMFDITTGNFLTGATGDFIWSGTSNTNYSPGFNTIIIEKRGTQSIRLWRKNDAGGATVAGPEGGLELVAEHSYESFPLVAAATAAASYTSPTGKDLVFGTLISGLSIQTQWQHVDAFVLPHSEFANQAEDITTGSTIAPNIVASTGTFATGTFPAGGNDVGRLVRVRDSQGANASGGNALGEWEVISQVSTMQLRVAGITQNRGSFTFQNRSWLKVRNREDAFIWPRHMGHSVEILDGANAGTYPIVGIVDPVTGKRFEDPVLNSNNGGASALALRSTDPTDGTIFTGTDGPTIKVVGQVSGAQTSATYTLNPDQAQVLSTDWDAGTIEGMELVPFILSGVSSTRTFRGDIVLYNVSDDSEILRIPAGEISAGKSVMTSLKTVDGAFYDATGALLPGAVNSVMNPPIEHMSDTVLLDTSALATGVFTVESGEVRWRIIPNFPAADASFDVVDVVLETAVADTYAQRDTKAWPGGYSNELVSIYRTKVLSGQMHDTKYPNDVNDFATQDYDLYPFYLHDEFGAARGVVDDLVAAGVTPDFDSGFIDSTGFHIQR